MATLVCFHAHPDDEALSTGGLMAKAAAAGHRVVVVTATNGEQGEPQPGVLAPGEELWERRIKEVAEACALLGAESRLLGYRDSGMMGESSNDDPSCFWQADVDEAAARLAEVLAEVSADVLTIYDEHGLYGHPDHIQVHRVGLRAAERAGVAQVYEATVNRDKAMASFAELPGDIPADQRPSIEEFEEFGLPETDLAYTVDVTAHLVAKKAAMVAHRSQIGDDSFFLKMPDEVFGVMFALESFAVPGRSGTGGPELVELLPGL